MKKFVSVGIILFVFFIIMYACINISQINNNIAVSDFNSGNYKNALTKFKRAALFRKKDDIIKYNLANTNTRIYDYETAKNMYLDLLKEQNLPKELKSEIYFNLGNIECMYENFNEALENYYMALTINPEDKDIKYNIELIEYLNRPIVYNNEILTFPKQKIEEQIRFMDKEDAFKEKVSNCLKSDMYNIYDDYVKFKDNEEQSHKQLRELNINRKLDVQKALVKFYESSNQYLKNLSVNNDRELQKKLNVIKNKIDKNNKKIEKYELIKQIIIKGTNTKEKLANILKEIKYKDGLREVIALEEYDPLSDENIEKSINIITRDCLSLLNQIQYHCFLEQSSEVIKDLNNILKTLKNDNNGDKSIIKKQILQIVQFVVSVYGNNILLNCSLFDKYVNMAQRSDNEIFQDLQNNSLNSFIVELRRNNGYDLTYEKTIFYCKELYKYNMDISNMHLLLSSLNERDLYNINCLEYTKNILEQGGSLSSKDIMEIYEFLNFVMSAVSEYITQMKTQKQICSAIEISNNANIDTILNILSFKFCLNCIGLKNNDFENIKKSFSGFLNSFEEKENEAQQVKNDIKKQSEELKELENQILYTEQNKHLYVDIKSAIKILENKKNIKINNINKEEVNLIKNIESFIEDFVPKLYYQVSCFKRSIKNTEILLKNIINIDNFKQRFSIDRFFIENKDLETELANFERNKKYLLTSGFKKEMDNMYSTDNLISKSIYQKQKLDELLAEEQNISSQIEKLKTQSEQLLIDEKKELDMLENDLIEKQMAVVKYYITVENNDTRTSMARQILSSLYKGKYETEQMDSILNLDLENFEYSNFRNSILILYKTYMLQLRELNKLMFRMKVINSILELETISKLNSRIEFDKQYFGSRNVVSLTNELNSFKHHKNQKSKRDMKEIIAIFKENISSAQELKKRLNEYQKKKQKIEMENDKRQKNNILNNISILDNKIELLKEHIEYNDENLNSKEDIERMKEEIKNMQKEKNKLLNQLDKIKMKHYDENLDKIMESIVSSSDAILDNIDKDGTKDNTLYISKSSVRTILKQQSNKDKYIPKEDENQMQVEIKNDW